jgi:YggT family protein
MFVFANLIEGLARVLSVILTFFYWAIIVRALISWVNADPYNPIVQFLHKLTEPLLEPIRRRLPIDLRLGIDISPLIAILIILFLKDFFLVRTLFEWAGRLRY